LETVRHPHRPPADLSRFWVISPISNPKRFSRRYELFFKFQDMIEAAGVNFCPIEQAFGLRDFMVTDAGNPRHIQVRSVDELWHKENLINKAVAYVVEKFGAREVAWVDADCRPSMPPRMWFEETWHALQHYKWVQMWQWLIDLNLAHNALGEPQPSFMYNYIKHGSPNPEEFVRLSANHAAKFGTDSEYYPSTEPHPAGVSKRTLFGRPGLAWAANVDDFEPIGGLIDFSILGAGDWYMAHGLVGSMRVTAGEHYSPAYAKHLMQWQKKALDHVRKDVGYVEGTVLHDFHGRKQLRGYNTRGRILKDCVFDPDTDIQRDRYGLYQLVNIDARQWQLRDRVRAYFKARSEDSTTGGEDE
jgi:hypothetical protein